jgi:putative DNA primase/helicase
MRPSDFDSLLANLGARRSGRGWVARCPAHDDERPSLSIGIGNDGRVLLHCFAGCAPSAVRDAVQKGHGINIGDHSTPQDAKQLQARPTDDKSRTAQALKIWAASKWPSGTGVETYLKARGIELLPSDRLRFHTGLRHPSGSVWPSMVALVSQGLDDRPSGIHRTFLAPSFKVKAPASPDKMMLGVCRGGAVRLGGSGSPLLIGEGIETTLSAMQATGLPGWAALSTSGLTSLTLPPDIRDVIILADGDEAGRRASFATGTRWRREGRRVRIAHAPDGKDFNDLVQRRTDEARHD